MPLFRRRAGVTTGGSGAANRVPDLLAELVAEPRTLGEELHGRPPRLSIFISSKMAGGVYVTERRRCAETIDGTGMAGAWYWERDANAGPYCSVEVCLRQAAHADGLILILGDQLTDTTRQEYEVARGRGLPTFVFVDQRQTQNAEAQAFVTAARGHSVTKNFANEDELRTHVLAALAEFVTRSWRQNSHEYWQRHRGGAA